MLKKNENRGIAELLDGKTITKRRETYVMRYWGHIQRREKDHVLQKS